MPHLLQRTAYCQWRRPIFPWLTECLWAFTPELLLESVLGPNTILDGAWPAPLLSRVLEK